MSGFPGWRQKNFPHFRRSAFTCQVFGHSDVLRLFSRFTGCRRCGDLAPSWAQPKSAQTLLRHSRAVPLRPQKVAPKPQVAVTPSREGVLPRQRRLRGVRWKIMVPYVLLTLVFAGLATYGITRMVTTSLQDRFNHQLVEVGRVTSDAMVRRESQQLSVLRAIAFTEGLPDAAAAGDRSQVERLVQPVATNSRAERVEVLDTRGNVLFATRLADASSLRYVPDSDLPDQTAWSAVHDVLAGHADAAGNKWSQIAATPQGLVLYTVGPIFDARGKLAGVGLVGTSLTSVVAAAKAESIADVTVYDLEGHTLVSTFTLGPDEVGALDPSAAPVTGSSARETRTLFGRNYGLLFGDLRLRNEVVGRYSVALPSDSVSSAGSTTQKQLSVTFGVITLAVLLIGWRLASHLTQPLSRLVSMAKAVSRGDLSARSHVRTSDEIGTLAATFDVMAERLQRQHLATIGALASAIDARDPYTAGHSMRVGDLSASLGGSLGMPAPALHHLRVGGILHDIGKIGVRDEVLLKAGPLTADERFLIQQHPRIGLKILEGTDIAPEVLAIVGGHHERLNGSGYPLGLSAEEISVFPRIAAVADVYDALTTSRPYREAMSPDEALKILRRESMEGILDPEIVAAMIAFEKEWEERRRSIETLTAAWAESLLQVKVA